ncbi:MAG: DUF3421 domain-containing protein [SAR324 cluster bacterium]|nr:DUF3421 domain-containing protein [SAR324 cluster bacterium]
MLIFLLLFIIGLSSSCFAQWHEVKSGILPYQSFQIKVGKGRNFYYCRDRQNNFGIIGNTEGCELIYGSTLLKEDYQVLVDPQENLGWFQVKQGNIPIGAFDAGRTPLLGEKYLCLKTKKGVPRQGVVIGNRCHYRFEDQIFTSHNFKILVHYWVDTKEIPPDAVASGKTDSGSQYICRVHYLGKYYPGSTGVGDRTCRITDELDYQMTFQDYQVQLYLPHIWVRFKSEKKIKNYVKAGHQSQFYICRGKFLKNIYLGKFNKETNYCSVLIGGGHLKLADFQLQIQTSD